MAAAPASIRRARPLLGTFVEIAVAGEALPGTAGVPPACDRLEAAMEAAFAAVATVHRLMSFHEPDSDLSRLNRDAAARAVTVHGWTCEVLETAVDLHRRSAGAFDISVAPALQRLGLLPVASGLGTPFPHDGRPPSPPAHGAGAEHQSIHLLPGNKVRFADPAVQIDLGGIAKGFAVDRAVDALRRHGITDGLVNAGGDLRVFGPRPHLIDIRDPRQPERTIFRVALRNAALASSAGRFDPVRSRHALSSAVIDPATALPAHAISGATVCAPACTIADALTKVVMNAGENAGTVLDHYGADALFVSSHGDACMTANWKNEVHLAA
jgi:thiamine biosynthesis lipoprotein